MPALTQTVLSRVDHFGRMNIDPFENAAIKVRIAGIGSSKVIRIINVM